MANHKNQHFVPRRLLKPFSLDGEGKAINLYAINKDLLVSDAPVKSQCARNYLYDEDGKIEAELAEIEGGYGKAVGRVVTGDETEDDLKSLRFFAYLQLRRTEIAAHRLRAIDEGLFEEIFGKDEPEKQPDRYYMLQSLDICGKTKDRIEDLKVRIIENRTNVEFVISDDPAVYTNRFAAQKQNKAGFGLMSSGLLLTMPLTTKLALICYDGLVYTAHDLEKGRIILAKHKDVEALNELQYLRATSCIYYSSWDSCEYVQKQFEAAKPHRTSEFAVFAHYIPIDEEENTYRQVSKKEAKAAGKSIIHSTFKYPTPSAWLSKLSFRNKPKTFTNGTAVGHVRKEDWLREAGSFG